MNFNDIISDPSELESAPRPSYAPAGVKLLCALVGFPRFGNKFFPINGGYGVSITLRVMDGDYKGLIFNAPLFSKFTENGWQGSDGHRKVFLKTLKALGVDFSGEIPTSGQEMCDMFAGEGKWEGTGELFGGLVSVTTGEPRLRSYINKNGVEVEAIDTTVDWWNPVDPEVATVFSGDAKALWAAEKARAAGGSGADFSSLPDDDDDEDDLPF